MLKSLIEYSVSVKRPDAVSTFYFCLYLHLHFSELITCLLHHNLHWLPVAARIEFKICMLAYQSLNSTAPAYIPDMLQPVSSLQHQTNLRSATNSELFVPRTRLRVGERAFSSAAPRLWNTLPTDIKRAATLLTFKKKLKTFLFSKHYADFTVFYHPLFSAHCICICKQLVI